MHLIWDTVTVWHEKCYMAIVHAYVIFNIFDWKDINTNLWDLCAAKCQEIKKQTQSYYHSQACQTITHNDYSLKSNTIKKQWLAIFKR